MRTNEFCVECKIDRFNPAFSGRDCEESTDGWHVWSGEPDETEEEEA